MLRDQSRSNAFVRVRSHHLSKLAKQAPRFAMAAPAVLDESMRHARDRAIAPPWKALHDSVLGTMSGNNRAATVPITNLRIA